MQFLTSLHPLSGHLGSTLWRKGDLCGSIPVSVIAVYDTKLFNLCKCINPLVESNPLLVNLYIIRAATKISGFLSTCEQHLWLKKQSPYPQDVVESLVLQAGMPDCIQVAAAKIPSSMEKPIETVTLHISAKEYYLDIIAKELGLEDASFILISRYGKIRAFLPRPPSPPLPPHLSWLLSNLLLFLAEMWVKHLLKQDYSLLHQDHFF